MGEITKEKRRETIEESTRDSVELVSDDLRVNSTRGRRDCR
jgi:hypothetical protein